MVDAFAQAKTQIVNQQFEELFAKKPYFELYKGYLQVKIEAITRSEFLNWLGYLESRLIALFVRLETLDAPLIVHPNSTPFKTENPNYPYSCCYYIGFAPLEKTNAPIDIGSYLIDFKERVTEWSGFTPGMFTKLTITKTASLPKLEEFILGDQNADEYQYEPEEDEFELCEAEEKSEFKIDVTIKPKAQEKKGKNNNNNNNDDVEKKKLATSDSIYHRILWDSQFNPEDFIIGYLDRFIGMKEISVLNFRDPNTLDTEYIPFHRVWYIRHKSGTKMWDRKARINMFA
jgi:uncharacterized protein (UPF0248 family)